MYVCQRRKDGRVLVDDWDDLCIKTGLERSIEGHGFELRMFICGR